jgi:hypothetical protein
MEDELSRACSMHRRELSTKFWYENLKERDHYEHLHMKGRIISKWILEHGDEPFSSIKFWELLEWIHNYWHLKDTQLPS